MQPIQPERPFADNIPAEKSVEEDLLFIIPLTLDHTTLRIQYFSDRVAVPLSPRPALTGRLLDAMASLTRRRRS
jgi:hypothetical protein